VKYPADTRDVAVGLAVVCGRVGVTAGKVALLPLRVAARSPVIGPALARTGESLAATGRTAGGRGRARLEAAAGEALVSPEAERAVDRALAGPLPEAVARSLIERQVVQRVTEQVLASAELEAAFVDEPAGFDRLVAGALDSRVVADVADQVIESAEVQRLVEEIASSPAVRAALTRQTTTFAEETATATRRRLEGLDDSAESRVHRWLRRPQAVAAGYGGLGTRGVAFAIDLALALVIFLVGAGVGAVVAALLGGFRPAWLADALAAVGWSAVVAVYLVSFWTVTGRTPGMSVMGLRVARPDGGPPNLGRSVLRLVGLVLAILPLFAGFVPVLIDGRRRALQDYIAGTVVRLEDEQEPGGRPAPAG
jgi:uncharacterized RDD family membrane protein YckC